MTSVTWLKEMKLQYEQVKYVWLMLNEFGVAIKNFLL